LLRRNFLDPTKINKYKPLKITPLSLYKEWECPHRLMWKGYGFSKRRVVVGKAEHSPNIIISLAR
jgi:hypothetical protein